VIIHNVKQGTQEWLELRARCFTASEAPAMMGDSKYTSREQLLREKKLWINNPDAYFKEKLFKKGHELEDKARPIAEALHGEELYPVTATSEDYPNLLASFDGLTLMEDYCWEHKMWNATLAENVRNQMLEPHYFWQLEQQLLVSKSTAAMFMTSDGTETNCVYFYYESVPSRRAQLIADWNQFEADLKGYTLQPKTEVIKADDVEDLPDLVVNVTGAVNDSNLEVYRTSALAFISAINTELETDHDFAVAEKTIKCCDKSEKLIEKAKEAALSQTADIAKVFETLDELKESMRQKRLELNRLVKSRKEELKKAILNNGSSALINHINEINLRLSKVMLPAIEADFAKAIKNKRNLQSMKDAVADELAKAKIEANRVAAIIEANLQTLATEAEGFDFLFNDLPHIATKDAADFINLVKARITEHKQAEEEKAQRQREADEKVQLQQQAQSTEVTSQTAPVIKHHVQPTEMSKSASEAVSGVHFQSRELIVPVTTYDEREHLRYFFGDEGMHDLYCDEHGNEYELEVVVRRVKTKTKKAA